ncbi:uncharacterized protein FA14DRAFT_163377 [Meira miltonrushii]|uniref:Sm domain-containing protein n=1 Tax=Meira miltonrushii TaxID=1280837 RepID=A0A316VJY1_9BASI|nr:uncharacterized protein FA14DRAFT_163377 [Meira miltonrushii]PWN37534.1 hypothetical protein FA14DRAFT_163377 [Meira miltonrushii]
MDADTILSHVPFTTSGSLVDCVDKKVIIILRDGKEHVGVLRSYDQFANLLIENPQQKCFDLVRGENVVMMGEIDLDKEDEIPTAISKTPSEQVSRSQYEKRKADVLRKVYGFSAEGQEGDSY